MISNGQKGLSYIYTDYQKFDWMLRIKVSTRRGSAETNMFEDLFKRKKLITGKLPVYGFQVEELVSKEHYYPGWHMNKKHWYTMVLDGSVTDEEIYERICISYQLAKK